VGSRPRIGDGILAPKVHRHRECAGRVLDSMGVNEVERATPSGLRRRRRLHSLQKAAPSRERERVLAVFKPATMPSTSATARFLLVYYVREPETSRPRW
jgi:hypothetical protein